MTDSSLEKAARGRAGVQVAVWNESSSWLGPLREYARISTVIRPGLRTDIVESARNGASDIKASADSNERRLHFLGWEVESLILKHRAQFTSALALLNHIFFHELGFNLQPDASAIKSDGASALLETVLARRDGPTTLVTILYAWVAEAVARHYGSHGKNHDGDVCDFLRIELVHGTPAEIVRVIPRDDRGEVILLDIKSNGVRVSESVWSSWCAVAPVDGFLRLTFAQGLVRSLVELFKLLEKTPQVSIDMLSAQLFVLDQIMNLQPSETSRWAERAMINTRRGDRSSALDDLKRFFAFHERETAPAAIVTLFDDLRSSH